MSRPARTPPAATALATLLLSAVARAHPNTESANLPPTVEKGPRPVLIEAEEAQRLIRDRKARVLDARGSRAVGPFLPGAVVTSWKDVRRSLLRDGRLAAPEVSRTHYAEKGVDIRLPAIVYGATDQAWGEEGRIWWDLKVLGHPETYILDGGIRAWTESQMRLASTPSGPKPGYFPDTGTEGERFRARHTDVVSLDRGGGLIIDARSKEEFEGATPYFSERGGHIPGAVHLHWKSLLDERGRLLPTDTLRKLIPKPGSHAQVSSKQGGQRDEAEQRPVISKRSAQGDRATEDPVIAYCTGGVRSAFVVAVLTHIGIPARNYDGSWWDWASRDDLPIE